MGRATRCILREDAIRCQPCQRQEFDSGADSATRELFSAWKRFVEVHPVARIFSPVQMGLCRNNPASIYPLDSTYLPAVPLHEIERSGRRRTAWYAADKAAVSEYLDFADRYSHLTDSAPCLRDEAELERHFPKPRDAVAYVMDTFPIVRRKDEETFGEYRTKHVVLDVYDSIQVSIATGAAYRTVLDPPPAELSC